MYDAVNALIDDEGNLFRRGGSAAFSTSDAANTPHGLADVLLAAGSRTIIWPGDPTAGFQVLDGSGVPVSVFTASRILAFARATPIPSGMVALPFHSGAQVVLYAGSLRTSDTFVTNVTLTNGSRTATSPGGASSFVTAGIDAGSFASYTGTHAIVQSVDSATQITLREPWTGATITDTVTFERYLTTGGSIGDQTLGIAFAGRRMLLLTKSRVYFTPIDNPFSLSATTDYHQIESEQLVGIQGMGNSALVFGSNGVYAIDELELDPVDDFGNIQMIVRKLNSDLVLWHDSGIAAYKGALVVPAIDDVWIFPIDGEPAPISGPGRVRSLYRSYVKAGYRPGTAVLHRGHYFLPIVNGTTWVDALVCRVDRGAAWTRWAGQGGSTAYAQRIGGTNRAPRLFGISGLRVIELTSSLDQTGNAQDADATTPTFTVESNDDDLGPGIRPNTAEKVRYVYETTGGTPTITVSSAVGPEGASYTAATLKRGGGASTGTDYSAWRVGRKAERIRFKFTTSSQVTSLILRRREVTIRQAGQT